MRWAIVIFLSALLYYSKPVMQNTVSFHPDEMYWVSTGRIVPLLLSGNTMHPYWNEYYGYANFNGAKLLYGLGLAAMGQGDYTPFGLPPATYYRFEPLGGKPFPADHPLFFMLRDGRMIAAVFGSAAVGLLFLWSRRVIGSTTGAVAAAGVFAIHPVTVTVATHAYADGMAILFIMILLHAVHRYLADGSKQTSWLTFGIWGGLLAVIVSIKLNGLLFLVPALLALGMKEKTIRKFTKHALVIISGFIIMFAVLHPNFFFYPDRGPAQIIADRMRITREHMEYFDARQPGHVLWNIPSRIASFSRQVFIWPWMTLVFAAVGAGFVLRGSQGAIAKRTMTIHIGVSTLVLFLGMMSYVVFDEGRYYLPILPYASLMSGWGFTVLYGRLQNWLTK